MSDQELILLDVLKRVPTHNLQALVLESYVQQYGPLPDDVGETVRQILEERRE